MKTGDLVREKYPPALRRQDQMGIILEVDWAHHVGKKGIQCPYLVAFFNGEQDWIRDGFLEVISEIS